MEIIAHKKYNPWMNELTLGGLYLTPTAHANQKAEQRGIELPKQISTNKGSIVELYATTNNPNDINPTYNVTKVLVRFTYNSTMDVCLVVLLNKGRRGVVVTAYLNKKGDNHATFTGSRAQINPKQLRLE